MNVAWPNCATVSTCDKTSDIEVSVVMPCLNEARTVGRCVDKARETLRALGVAGEVIVADNGSSDESADIARSKGCRVVDVHVRGYGSALRGGLAAARGRYVIIADADESYDLTNLAPFVARLRQGDDLVMGNRFQGGIRPGAMPWAHRYIGNPALTAILNLFFHTPVHDAHCGMRGIRKEAYECLDLRSSGMEFASEMVVKACLRGQKISEVPIVLYPDGRGRRPHLRTFRDGWRHLRFLLLMCPLWLYLIPSGILVMGGLSLMMWLTAGPRPVGASVLDVHTLLLGTLCVLVGYQTLWFWSFSKMHGWATGLLPATSVSRRMFNHMSVERGLMAGTIFLSTGLGLHLWLVAEWVGRECGALDVPVTLRYGLWGLALMVMGVQTIYGSFFLSMLGMTQKTAETTIAGQLGEHGSDHTRESGPL